ncbi:hypothetical protein BJI67_10705 [Acidihalobacter aeolianus]|uniref:FCP1 homology domain-containing protein n=1 Tax=Acidihalobacter aeolianus TaxID=2792603 RepID=A0A1D8K933_9GAMM|nr:hypothetical protein BJI67_10705 [Acidihalobacter aeolianus]
MLYGGCVTELLAKAGQRLGMKVEHLLYQSGLHEEPTLPLRSSFDAVLVGFAFRTLVGQSAERLLGFHDADLVYQKNLPYDELLSTIKSLIDQLLSKFQSVFLGKSPVFFLSFIEPPQTSAGLLNARNSGGIYRLSRDINDYMAERLAHIDGAYYLETNDLLRAYGDRDWYDGYEVCYAHSGIHGDTSARSFPAAVMRRVGKVLAVLHQEQPVKLIVTDLDGTLWKGVLAEEDEIIPGDHTEGWPIGYAEALMACKKRGILLAICSKNDEASTRTNFDKVWYGRMRLEDFCSVKINWQPKSKNLFEILKEVNILPENVLFIDDNPLEIAEVIRAFPGMRTLTGDPHVWRMELLYGVPFQTPRMTEESAKKTELIQAKITRDREMAQTDRASYLRDLAMVVDVFPVTHQDDKLYARAFELLNKTNQFNTTGRRWTAEELTRFLGEGGLLYALRASDRLADHGVVGLALLYADRLEQMVLSCRVFGLGLEDALLHRVASMDGATNGVVAKWHETGKNATAKHFLERHFIFEAEAWHLRQLPLFPEHVKLRE